MGFTYAERKKAGAKASVPQDSAARRFSALQSGLSKPTSAEMGHRVDLPDAMRAKMENSFGADLSAVKLYESQSVADAGAEAITQGSSIAFAPGKLDLVSSGGQALLGHELSHVVSQQRGEVSQRGGFLNDQALEARADREGAMAAAGESVGSAYGGAVAPLSSASAAPAAGPMQAKRKKNTDEEKAAIDPSVAMKEAGTGNTYENGQDFIAKKNTVKNDLVDNSSGRQELQKRLNSKYEGAQYKEGAFTN